MKIRETNASGVNLATLAFCESKRLPQSYFEKCCLACQGGSWLLTYFQSVEEDIEDCNNFQSVEFCVETRRNKSEKSNNLALRRMTLTQDTIGAI